MIASLPERSEFMGIHESGEMYLETIHVLLKKNGAVRSVDISEHMGYSKPSVSRAVGLLKNGGYILVDKDGYITLTQSGVAVAEKIYERHTVLSSLLIALGVSKQTATEDACRLEHAISDESFDAIKRYVGRM
jgi:Mn-dependent DtxR family transcriptional regulator